MFEKEAEKYREEWQNKGYYFVSQEMEQIELDDIVDATFKDGAEFGYNKANEWHFVSEKGLPKESGRYLVYVGGGEKGIYPLDFETEYNDFGYWCVEVASASLGVTDTVFETITERNEDEVIAWKEIVLPELKESE